MEQGLQGWDRDPDVEGAAVTPGPVIGTCRV